MVVFSLRVVLLEPTKVTYASTPLIHRNRRMPASLANRRPRQHSRVSRGTTSVRSPAPPSASSQAAWATAVLCYGMPIRWSSRAPMINSTTPRDYWQPSILYMRVPWTLWNSTPTRPTCWLWEGRMLLWLISRRISVSPRYLVPVTPISMATTILLVFHGTGKSPIY